MTSNLAASVALTRDKFLADLTQAGWDVDDDGRALGTVDLPDGRHPALEIIPDERFPFKPPKVRPVDGSGSRSWHQDPDGALCLYATEDSDDLPWLDIPALLDRIALWYEKDANGWPDDPPDLDLERYFAAVPRPRWKPPGRKFVVCEDLDACVDASVVWMHAQGHHFELTVDQPPRKARGTMRGWSGDLGELEAPVRSWDEICDALGDAAEELKREVAQGRISFVLLRYSRLGHVGALLLELDPIVDRAAGPPLRLATIALADDETLFMRSGPDVDTLREKAVAIVGVGAVGSQIADQLARGGVGRLTLVDPDVLRPGNSIRHLVGKEGWGRPKAEAVAEAIDSFDVEVTVAVLRFDTAEQAAALFSEHDLVIDATADGCASRLVEAASVAGLGTSLSIYLQRDGEVARIDRWPLADREEPLEEVPPIGAQSGPALRESGCGDPVSPTPPWAAQAAAALATSEAVALLAGEHVPATVVHALRPQPDQDDHPEWRRWR